MTPHEPLPPLPPDSAVGDANVARLLGQSYEPPPVPPEFARRLQAHLIQVAAEAARQRGAVPAGPRWRPSPRRLASLAAAALLLVVFALGLRLAPRPEVSRPTPPPVAVQGTEDFRLTASPLPARPRTVRLQPGVTLATGAGERRRFDLDDGSVVSLNESTSLRYDAGRHLTLHHGEAFIEAASDRPEAAFTVHTPQRVIRATGKFLVRTAAAGTGVVVTQGRARVGDRDEPLTAGQEIAPGADTPSPAPRASHLLAWAQDLVSDGTPLVPLSSYAGGALIVLGPDGRPARLSLRKYHVDVHVEDGFARTTIDQTYFNHTPVRLEGTFHFPLPADASLSRLAMYVEGKLMEGGMVEREYGRQVFEQIVTKMKDPALLEWVDGRTFKMRVFPLEGWHEKRIVLSYTQKLPSLYGRASYRFPAGHSLEQVRDWSFHARVKGGEHLSWYCGSHALKARTEAGDLLLDGSGHDVKMYRDVALDLEDSAGGQVEQVRFSTAEHEGARYLMVRYRPDLPGYPQRQRRDWVVLFESSADRDPLLARAQVEIVRTLLNHAEPEDTFTVLTAGRRVTRFAPSPRSATKENTAAAVAFLEKTRLLGGLDLGTALDAAGEAVKQVRNPYLVHVGSARPIVGENDVAALLRRLPTGATYVGIGVGKQDNHDFMQRAAEATQGYATQINPDEPVAWRAFDLLATLATPRLLGVQVSDPDGKAVFLGQAPTVAQGEEVCAIARLDAKAPLPKAVRVRGTLAGQPFERLLPVASPRPGADYLPRTWAKLEIERLLVEDRQKNKDRIVALSKAMYVMTPFTSLLVLENEAMYAQFKVDRGRKDHWAMYPCPERIPFVMEPPAPGEPNPWARNYYAFNGRSWEGLQNFWPATDGAGLDDGWGGGNLNGVFMMDGSVRSLAPLVDAGGDVKNMPWSPDLDLTNTDIGIDDKVQTNYFVDRIEDVSVPGPVDPTLSPYLNMLRGGDPAANYFLGTLPDFQRRQEDAVRRNVPLPPGTRGGNGAAPLFFRMYPFISSIRDGTSNTIWMADRTWLVTPWDMPLPQKDLQKVQEARRKIIEEALWEQQRRPKSAEVRQRILTGAMDQARKDPPVQDIWSARTLNVLLQHLIDQQRRGEKGINVALDTDLLRSINLSPAGARANLGLLRRGGELQWPLVLQDTPFKEPREAINRRVAQASQLLEANGTLDSRMVEDMKRSLAALDNQLLASVNDLTPIQYIEAKRYLNLLRDAVRALEDPKVAGYFNKNWVPQVKTVGELVKFMADKRLEFAPATPDDRAAYQALHRALVASDTGSGPQGSVPATEPRQPRFLAPVPAPARNPAAVERAERALAASLTDPTLAGRSDLWRRAAWVAAQRGRYGLAVERLERAMQIESRLPVRPHPVALWRDYFLILTCLALQADELAELGRAAPPELIDRVVRVADRWRSLDADGRTPCQAAAAVLHRLGARDLAWDYLTTALVGQGGGAAAWRALAAQQRQEGYAELADEMMTSPLPR
jgi:hypothetical protein